MKKRVIAAAVLLATCSVQANLLNEKTFGAGEGSDRYRFSNNYGNIPLTASDQYMWVSREASADAYQLETVDISLGNAGGYAAVSGQDGTRSALFRSSAKRGLVQVVPVDVKNGTRVEFSTLMALVGQAGNADGSIQVVGFNSFSGLTVDLGGDASFTGGTYDVLINEVVPASTYAGTTLREFKASAYAASDYDYLAVIIGGTAGINNSLTDFVAFDYVSLEITGSPVPYGYRVPLFIPDFEYTTSQVGGWYSEQQTAQALHPAWTEDIQHYSVFPNGLSSDPELEYQIPDGEGGSINIGVLPDAVQLQALRNALTIQTGDEMLAEIQAGVWDSKAHTFFIYGLFTQNINEYYYRYRISGDRYYLDQIVKYAECVDWLIDHNPKQFLPIDRRNDPIVNLPEEITYDQPASLAIFRAHSMASWLLLEAIGSIQTGQDSADVAKAKTFINTINTYIQAQVDAPYSATIDGLTFSEGANTTRIRQEFGIPERAAQLIEYSAWNATWWYCGTLAPTAKAIERYKQLTGEAKPTWTSKADIYKNVVLAAMDTFQQESVCVTREGWPYLFHCYIANRDEMPGTKPTVYRLGVELFVGEDYSHTGAGAILLPYIWDVGVDYGVSEVLLRAYANGYLLQLNSPVTTKDGVPWPGKFFDSPWTIAAKGINATTGGPNDNYLRLSAFSPYMVQSTLAYKTSNQIPLYDANNVQRHYASYLYLLSLDGRFGYGDIGTKVEAEKYDAQNGIQIVSNFKVGYVNNGNWIRFDDMGITGATSFKASVSSATSGGTLEIRSSSASGPLIGSVTVNSTGGWSSFETVSTSNLSNISTVNDIYLVFVGGGGYLFDVDWIQFD